MQKFTRIVFAAGLLALAAAAGATEVPNSAAVFERVFDDCPFSTLTVVNDYPDAISIEDVKNDCGAGFANRHAWRFSQDGVTAQQFSNHNGFRIGATVTLEGTGEGEAGIGISPWWSPLVDGVFNLRTTDGEVAVFGGRLPFYSFTSEQGLTYVPGTAVRLEIEYLPHGLEEGDPGTVQYFYGVDQVTYVSPVLDFDEGNPEEPYGTWGIADEATAGGYMQFFLADGADDAGLTAQFDNITFVDLGDAVANEGATYGAVKSLFR